MGRDEITEKERMPCNRAFWVICVCVCVTNDEIDGADDASVHRTVNVFRTKISTTM